MYATLMYRGVSSRRLASPQELREAFDGAGVPLDIDDCQQPGGSESGVV